MIPVPHEVFTDGKTVWVNGPNCLGRFCRYSAEVVVYNSETAQDEVLRVTGPGERTSAAEWDWFVEAVSEHHGIMIELSAPEYARRP